MTVSSLPRPLVLALQWPFRRSADRFAAPTPRDAQGRLKVNRNRGADGMAARPSPLLQDLPDAPDVPDLPDLPDSPGLPPFAGLRIARAVLPARSSSSRVPAIVRRSPCRLPDGHRAATLRSDPQDPRRVRISGRLSEVCAALDRLVDGLEGAAAA